MAITTNDAIVKLGTTKTLEATGAAIANNAIGEADDASYSIATDGSNAPDAEFVLTGTFAVAPTINTALELIARPLNIDGTADAEAPTATFRQLRIGFFVVNAVTTSQAISLLACDVPREASYFIYNNATGQTLAAGWTLKVTPRTLGPAV